jgi:nucleotide-binding universal stress UspA family protein
VKTIVVGYDGSPPARLALERAARLAQAFDSKVVVATVKEPLAAEQRSPPADTPSRRLLFLPISQLSRSRRSACSLRRAPIWRATASLLKLRHRSAHQWQRSSMPPKRTMPT